jgi:hypothetical protein
MKTILQGPEALSLFTDRHAAVRHFLDELHVDRPAAPIILFEGEAGIGKSLLLRYVHTNCCKRFRPDDWQYIREQAAPDFVRHIEAGENSAVMPSAFVELADDGRGCSRSYSTMGAQPTLSAALAAGDGARFHPCRR